MSKITIAPEHQEIEVRFLEINAEAIKQKLEELGAEDLGDELLEEVIFYDQDRTWLDERRFIRLRTRKGKTTLTYKQHHASTATDTEEIEFEVSDSSKAEAFLEKLGYHAFRHQQKKRHSYQFGEAEIDIDTWPQIPTYLEIEGSSEDVLRTTAEMLGLEWGDAVFEDARKIIEGRYNIPVSQMTWFTFERFE
jgi:adenylate cyclase, class 2